MTILPSAVKPPPRTGGVANDLFSQSEESCRIGLPIKGGQGARMQRLSNGFDYKASSALDYGLAPDPLPNRLPWQVSASLIIGLSTALWAGLGLLAERVFS
jgi:hypothetical protein